MFREGPESTGIIKNFICVDLALNPTSRLHFALPRDRAALLVAQTRRTAARKPLSLACAKAIPLLVRALDISVKLHDKTLDEVALLDLSAVRREYLRVFHIRSMAYACYVSLI